ncbi:MAG: hypothetical protein LBI37_01535 [Puniceicoccales bacterium]|jgi:ankyrin repeat protein|nr:hypothetical protein [Puniceicoccales bacterium]
MGMVKLSKLVIGSLLSVLWLSDVSQLMGVPVNKHESQNTLRAVYTLDPQKRQQKRITIDTRDKNKININVKSQEDSKPPEDKKDDKESKINVKNQNKFSNVVLKSGPKRQKITKNHRVVLAPGSHVVKKNKPTGPRKVKNKPAVVTKKRQMQTKHNGKNVAKKIAPPVKEPETINQNKSLPKNKKEIVAIARNTKPQPSINPKIKAFEESKQHRPSLKITGQNVAWNPQTSHAVDLKTSPQGNNKNAIKAKAEIMNESQIDRIKIVMSSLFKENRPTDAQRAIIYDIDKNKAIIINYKQMAAEGLSSSCVEILPSYNSPIADKKAENARFSLLHLAVMLIDKDRSTLLEKIKDEPTFDIGVKSSFIFHQNIFTDYTPLHLAIWLENISAITDIINVAKSKSKLSEIMLDKASCEYIDGAFIKKATAMHIAIFSEKIENGARMLTHLIGCVNSPDLIDTILLLKADTRSHGQILIQDGTPLVFAMMKNQASIAKILEISKNRKIDLSEQTCKKLELTGTVCINVTPIHIAITFSDYNNLKTYIPIMLDIAKESGSFQGILQEKANVKASSLSITDGNILHFAILGEKEGKTALDILSNCIDLNLGSIALLAVADMESNGNLSIHSGTPLFFAMANVIDSVIEKILKLAKEHKIDVTTKSCEQLKFSESTLSSATPLHLAAIADKLMKYVPALLQTAKELERRSLLLLAQADIETSNISVIGGTVLHFAATLSNQSVGSQLMDVANELSIDVNSSKCKKYIYKGREFEEATFEQITSYVKN